MHCLKRRFLRVNLVMVLFTLRDHPAIVKRHGHWWGSLDPPRDRREAVERRGLDTCSVIACARRGLIRFTLLNPDASEAILTVAGARALKNGGRA